MEDTFFRIGGSRGKERIFPYVYRICKEIVTVLRNISEIPTLIHQNPNTMNKKFFVSMVALLIPLFLYAQADRILGTWITEKGTSSVEIYKDSNGKFHGKINWLEEPNENGKPKVDDENPNPKLRSRPIMGLPLVRNFQYSTKKKQWVNGRIYDPDNGKTYDCFAWFEGRNYNKLYLKGYVAGIRALGRKTEWVRK
jgi:uncharacterized protein (DUF2147 family)